MVGEGGRMKAILVIDVPVEDSIDFGHKDIRGTVIVKAYNDTDFQSLFFEHIKVEPFIIPGVNKERLKSLNMSVENHHYYELGHDDCADEIYERYEQ